MQRSAVAVLCALGLGAAAVAAPVIAVDEPSYAVSIPKAGVTVHHVFVLTNQGDEPLTITRVYASCGCTATSLSRSVLDPGQSVGLPVAVNTTGFSGTIERTAVVQSNDPVHPNLVLRVVVTVTGATEAPGVTVLDLQKRFLVLLDVRSAAEYRLGHLFGAVNVPLLDLELNLAQWVERLPRDVPIVCYCATGALGKQAAQILNQAGFVNATYLVGGLQGWTEVFGPRYLLRF